ncbi:hypothetical protein EC973_009067 [Apophysomyces ossiformis]|uniref:Uncharacterized protein n=1 Tax=Apophysomyces ossiformis TaxID=679940 RepID=A0A8H7BK94_9FUNG|nr:hypothetical protein EC973_009067 [Apophysomyces ossiformis]
MFFAQLLKWIITIYDLLDSTERITKMYTVLFHYLPSETLRPYLCHLLYFMTQRVHVKPYRIRKLIDLTEQFGPEPALYGLLSIYKKYKPEINLPFRTQRGGLLFAHPDPQMKEAIEDVHNIWSDLDVADEVRLHKPILSGVKHSVSLMDIVGASELAENIDRLKLPDQMVSILENRILQHAVVCNPNPTTIARISQWLTQNLMDMVKWTNKTERNRLLFKDLVQKTITMTRFTKAHLPDLEIFLRDFLKTWNGTEFEKEIFELLTYVKPDSFDGIYTTIISFILTWNFGLKSYMCPS